jgi:hypothetical protein
MCTLFLAHSATLCNTVDSQAKSIMAHTMAAALLGLTVCVSVVSAAATATPPHIVMVLTDGESALLCIVCVFCTCHPASKLLHTPAPRTA